jgi:hypothetical protein
VVQYPGVGGKRAHTDKEAENFPVLRGGKDGDPVVLATSSGFTGRTVSVHELTKESLVAYSDAISAMEITTVNMPQATPKNTQIAPAGPPLRRASVPVLIKPVNPILFLLMWSSGEELTQGQKAMSNLQSPRSPPMLQPSKDAIDC